MTAVAPKARFDWVDAGRGLAIFLVVMFHTAQWLREAGIPVAGWLYLNETLASLRLPLFFVMAGLFAQKWMTAPWAQLWGKKLSLFVWVYVLWSGIATLTFMLGLHMQGILGNPLRQIANLIWLPFLPRFELWFIWALALFFVTARALRRVPPWIQLATSGLLAAVALSWFTMWFPSGNTGWLGLARYFFFFLVGLLLRERILRLSTRVSPTVLVIGFVAWLTAAVAGSILDWAGAVPGYYFATCLLGLVAGLGLARVLSRWGGVRRLGAQTLPVYVTHTSIILVAAWLLWRIGDVLASPIGGWLLVPTVAIGAVAGSVAFARWAENRTPWQYLYESPRWISGVSAGDPTTRSRG